MNVTAGESQQLTKTSGTYNGLLLAALMVHGTANTAFATTDFAPQNVSIKVLLKKQDRTFIIMQDNLLILGTKSSLRGTYHEFLNGLDLVYPSSGVKANKLRSVFIDFGGHIKVNAGDEFIVEITASSNCFSSSVDATKSYIDFSLQSSIGYSTHIPQTKSQVVKAGTNSEDFNLGDNVLDAVFLNFDKNTHADPIITTATLSSDRLDWTKNSNQLYAAQCLSYAKIPPFRLGTSLPISTPTAPRGLDYLPQSLVLFDGIKDGTELDRCSINLSFNSANVAASQNYLVYTTYVTNMDMLIQAEQSNLKHSAEKAEKIQNTK